MAKVTTIHGEMDEADLVKRETPSPGGAVVTEYYLGSQLVHRSSAVQLSGVSATGVAKL